MKIINILSFGFAKKYFRVSFMNIDNMFKDRSLLGFFYNEGDVIVDFLFKEYQIREGGSWLK